MSNDLFRGKYQLFTPQQARFFRRLLILTEAFSSVASYVAMVLYVKVFVVIVVIHDSLCVQ